MIINSIESLNRLIYIVKESQQQYANFNQEQVNKIFKAVASAASAARIPLAKLACEETGKGVIEDKIIKNHFASEMVYNQYKNTKTCGIISEDRGANTFQVADPVGIIAGIIPVTNPTSTVIFKALISLLSRNAIIFAPHPKAKRATCEAARIVHEAAVAAGAPPCIVGWIQEPSLELSDHLMRHPDIKLILATGGPGMVKAAYSSGKPAIGVGAGNTPAVIGQYADVPRAVHSIVTSKTFDNGMVCASEQTVIVVQDRYDEAVEEFCHSGCYLVDDYIEYSSLKNTVFNECGGLNPEIVGQSAVRIAEIAGFTVPKNTRILLVPVWFDDENPLCQEKLSPVLTLVKAGNFAGATDIAAEILKIGGVGHTAVLHTDQDNQIESVRYFSDKIKTARILINQPATHGAIGDLYNFGITPSLTLGCGSWSGNSVSGNIGVQHLLNIKTVAMRSENALWHNLPKQIYFRRGCLPEALKDLKEFHKAVIVTDQYLFEHGYCDETMAILANMGISSDVFWEVEADPNTAIVERGLQMIRRIKPDVIIALGGGSPMDAAKIMWLMYEHPEVQFSDIALRFMDIRKRIHTFKKNGVKATFVAIPTTSGTGSEVTPFAVVTDAKTGQKYPIADYALTPSMAIVDANMVMDMPKSLVAAGGIDAIVHAIEAYVSVVANEFSDGQALTALKLLNEYLPASYRNGASDPVAREKVHNAATIAGIAFANSFLGVCHSMAHKIGSRFHIPHGIANGLLISNVIRYNAADGRKMTAFSQYGRPQSKKRYVQIARHLGFDVSRDIDGVNELIEWIDETKRLLEIPKSIKDYGIDEAEFMASVDELAADSFDDQCTGANPRSPLISELKQLLISSYYGYAYSE